MPKTIKGNTFQQARCHRQRSKSMDFYLTAARWFSKYLNFSRLSVGPHQYHSSFISTISTFRFSFPISLSSDLLPHFAQLPCCTLTWVKTCHAARRILFSYKCLGVIYNGKSLYHTKFLVCAERRLLYNGWYSWESSACGGDLIKMPFTSAKMIWQIQNKRFSNSIIFDTIAPLKKYFARAHEPRATTTKTSVCQ